MVEECLSTYGARTEISTANKGSTVAKITVAAIAQKAKFSGALFHVRLVGSGVVGSRDTVLLVLQMGRNRHSPDPELGRIQLHE